MEFSDIKITKIVLKEKIKDIGGNPWNPVDLLRANDQVVRLALCRGEYHWHKHSHGDELFYVLRGQLTIQLKAPNSDITLNEGELAVVPRGIEHCPKSSVDTYVLVFEPSALKSKGD